MGIREEPPTNGHQGGTAKGDDDMFCKLEVRACNGERRHAQRRRGAHVLAPQNDLAKVLSFSVSWYDFSVQKMETFPVIIARSSC